MVGALALLPFCGPARAAGRSWRERLDDAEQLSKEGKNAESAAATQGVLADAETSLGPEAPEIGHVLVRLSHIYETVQDAPRLSEIEKRLSAIKSKDFEIWLALGVLLQSQGKSHEAEGALKKALALKPGDFEAEQELAMVDQDLGRDVDAAKLFEEAIKKTPQVYDLYIHLARSDMRLGRVAEAEEAFVKARKIKGRMADAYIQEGYFHLEVGESLQAKEAFESAIAVDTASPFGYHHMGSYLSRGGRFLEAEKYFRQALERLEADPSAKIDDRLHTIIFLGGTLQMQGRSAEAVAVYRKCLETAVPSGKYADCLRSLGQLYVDQHEFAEAEDVYKRAAGTCEHGPTCACRGMALIELGNVYFKEGRKREAESMADQAGKSCADDMSELSLLLDRAGLYVSLGDASKGETLFDRILAARESRPLSGGKFKAALPLALERMADLEMAQGRFREAEAFYRHAIPMFENGRDEQAEGAALGGLAAACEKEGKSQEAADARGKAISLRTDGASFPSAAF